MVSCLESRLEEAYRIDQPPVFGNPSFGNQGLRNARNVALESLLSGPCFWFWGGLLDARLASCRGQSRPESGGGLGGGEVLGCSVNLVVTSLLS